MIELILSFAGVAIAGIVYVARVRGIDLPCSSGDGCSLVEASHWATFYGVPVALLGTAAYVVLALLSVVKLNATQVKLERWVRSIMLLITGCGFLYSWYLQYVAKVFIGTYCPRCRASAVTMTVLFLVVLVETIRSAYVPKAALIDAAQTDHLSQV